MALNGVLEGQPRIPPLRSICLRGVGIGMFQLLIHSPHIIVSLNMCQFIGGLRQTFMCLMLDSWSLFPRNEQGTRGAQQQVQAVDCQHPRKQGFV